jgi:hypothetical protein
MHQKRERKKNGKGNRKGTEKERKMIFFFVKNLLPWRILPYLLSTEGRQFLTNTRQILPRLDLVHLALKESKMSLKHDSGKKCSKKVATLAQVNGCMLARVFINSLETGPMIPAHTPKTKVSGAARRPLQRSNFFRDARADNSPT